MRLIFPSERVYIALSSCLILVVFLLNLSWGIRNSFGRDENMFVAGAELAAGYSLVPYQDYHYLHPPNQILLYRLLFELTDYFLLAGRALSAACAAGIAAIVLWMVRGFFSDQSRIMGYLFAWLGVLFLTANPLYIFVGGYLWDYNLSELFAILCFALLIKGRKSIIPGRWLWVSGLAYGLAIGTRLNYATGLIPIYFLLAIYPSWISMSSYIKKGLIFTLGLAIGLLPTLFYALLSPAKFWFDNITYHRLNTTFRAETAFQGPLDFGERISYFWGSVISQPGNLLLLVALVYMGYIFLLPRIRQNKNIDFIAVALLTSVPFIGIGAFLSSPAWYQYFYAAVPFAICAAAYGLSKALESEGGLGRRWAQLFILLIVLANLYQLQEYRRMNFLLHPETWRPLQLHQLGQKIKDVVGEGKILTMAPEIALEAGLAIYPEFATGPFIWRVASLFSDQERADLDLVAPGDLDAFLAKDPPTAILVGIEPTYELPLLDYASRHGYKRVEITKDVALWMPSLGEP